MATAPIAAGILLDAWLTGSEDAISVFHVFFTAAALLQMLVFLPLRSFTRCEHQMG